MQGQPKTRHPNFQRFIDKTPGNYTYETHYTGDLNQDERPDVVVLARSEKPTATRLPEGHDRRVLLLIGGPDGQFRIAATNDQVVDCTVCGGVLGDPHEGVTIKSGYVSFESRYGGNHRTFQVITFRYDHNRRDWFLYKIGLQNYVSATGEVKPIQVRTSRHFGQVRFQDFRERLIFGTN